MGHLSLRVVAARNRNMNVLDFHYLGPLHHTSPAVTAIDVAGPSMFHGLALSFEELR